LTNSNGDGSNQLVVRIIMIRRERIQVAFKQLSIEYGSAIQVPTIYSASIIE